MKNKKQTRDYVITASLMAIMFLMYAVPFLGFIPIGPIKATTLHVPVIIGSILVGPVLGGFLGGTFGLISLWNATINPTPLSFVFSPFIPVIGSEYGDWKALIIAFVPRILIGVIPYYVHSFLPNRIKKNSKLSFFLSGIVGSITNTLLVMNLIYLLFYTSYSQLLGKTGSVLYQAVISVIFTNGIPEAIIAGIITSTICISFAKLARVSNNFNI